MHQYIVKNGITKIIARSGIVASIYIVLSMLVTFNFGFIDIRVSECLTLLPLILPESIIALFVGCLVSNILLGCVVYDIIFGSLVTLLSALLTFYIGRKINKSYLKILLGGLPPVILNAFLVPLTWYFAGLEQQTIYIIQVLAMVLGQVISVYVIGGFLIVKTQKYKLFK